MVSITTLLGGEYFARAEDIEAARSRGERDVPLCLPDGSPVPPESFARARLRLSTIEAATLTLLPPAPAAQAQIRQPNTMRSADKEMLTEAKRKVDLAAFLAEHGFVIVPEKDSIRNRIMDGPGGVKVRVSLAPRTGDWVYEDLRAGGGGDILKACKNLLGMTYGRALGTIRAANQNPPPPLTNRRGISTVVANHQRLPTRSLRPLGESGRRYLVEERCLHPSTLETFAHSIQSNTQGSVVFPHNLMGDGEERGPGWQSFYGGQHDGPGRGRSLHLAVPHASQEPPTQLIVAESGISGYSLWEMLDNDAQPRTGVASSGGPFSEAGEDKLRRTLRRMVNHHEGQGAPILIDATDVNEKPSKQRSAWLQKLADEVGVIYHRALLSREGVTDWNEELQAVKAAFQAQAAEQARAADLPPKPEPEPTQSVRIKSGNGRSM